MQTKLDALLIADERLDERQFLGLEQQPDAMIKDVQTDVHGPVDVDSVPPEGGAADGGDPEGVGEPAVRTRR